MRSQSGTAEKGCLQSRVGEILGLEGSSYLDELLSQGLIYCGPSRKWNLWRPTHVGADSNIALLPISEFSAKLLMSSRICQTTTLYRLILASDSPSKQKIKNAK